MQPDVEMGKALAALQRRIVDLERRGVSLSALSDALDEVGGIGGIDGGRADSNYGGTVAIDGGTA